MKKLSFLILLLLSPTVYAYNAMELCGSVGKYYLKNYCPPNLTSALAGQNKTTTTAEGSVYLANLEDNLSPTTVHACVYLSTLTDPSYSQIIDGQFCTRKRTKTASSDGTVSFSGTDKFTNLLAGTSYKVAYAADTSSISNVVGVSGTFTTINDSPPDPGGIPIVIANSYFVNSLAGGGGDGSFGAPWDDITDVNNATIPTSKEVWFKEGTTYVGELTIDWNGSANDNSIVGCYYVENGTPFQCGTANTKPKINGNQADGRVLNINGDYITFKTIELDGNPGFTDYYNNNFQVNVTGEFVTIDDLYINGFGSKQAVYDYKVAIGGRNGQWKLGGVRASGAGDFTLKNSIVRHNMFQSLKITDCSKRSIIENNILGYGYSDAMRVDPCKSGGPDSPNTFHKILIRNNILESGMVSDGIQTNAYNYIEDGETGNRGGAIIDNLIIKVPPCTTENGVDLKGGDYWLVQGNVFYGHEGKNNGCFEELPYRDVYNGAAMMTGNSGGALVDAEGNTMYVTARNNIIYDSNGGSKAHHNWTLIQNTMVGNNHNETGPDATFKADQFAPLSTVYFSRDGAIVGNIFTDHKGKMMQLYLNNATGSWQGHLDFNVYSPGYVGTANFSDQLGTIYSTFASWKTELQGEANITGKDANSINEYPNFVNVPTPIVGAYDTMDFNISGNAVDLVTYHTQTDGTGASSTSVKVDNACVFFDSLGIADLEPDWIKIGTNDHVQIVSESIDCVTDTFNIDTPQTWGDNEGVIRTDEFGTAYNDAGACQNGVCPLNDETGTPPPQTEPKKWNPGHYAMVYQGPIQNDVNQVDRFNWYDSIGDDPSILGVTLRTSWGSLERDTKGNYQPGFDWIQDELDYLAALPVPKRLWIRIQERHPTSSTYYCYDGTYTFNSANVFTWYMPQYLRAIPNTTNLTGSNCRPRMWESYVSDHYIDMLEAYGARFDSDPLFEGLTIWKESAASGSTADPGWTSAKMLTEWERIGTATLSAWPTTNIVFNTNSWAAGLTPATILDMQARIGLGQGGPDIAPDCIGTDLDCSAGFAVPQADEGCCETTYNYIYTENLGSQVPISYSIELSELGSDAVGRNGGYSPQALYNFCTQWSLQCNHMFWHAQTSYGTDEQQWETGIKPFINANPFLNSTCPSSYVNGCITGTLPSSPPGTGPNVTPLTVSTNGRYFEKDGEPFFWLADTAWYLMLLTEEEVNTYLQNRAAKGINIIQGPQLLKNSNWPSLIDYTYLEANPYGFQPLTSDSPVTLNENYWQHIDYIVNKANSLGMYIAMPIIWGNNLDLLFNADAGGNVQADKLGELIATRYNTYDNIIWFVTGEWQKIAWQSEPRDDTTPSAAELALIRALAGGLYDHKKSTQLMTIHPDALSSATNEFKNDNWLDFNQYQSYANTANSVNFANITYAYSPTKPTIQTEGGYEGPDAYGFPNGWSAWEVRVQAWTGVLSGSAGYTYGAWIGWQFAPTWPQALELEGIFDAVVMKNFFETLSWELLAPSQSMITSGVGSAGARTYVAIQKASDNSFAVAYASNGNSFTLNLSSMSGTVRANWVNPRTGDFTLIGNFNNTSGVVFNPPGNPADNNDWALLLEVI